MHGDGQAWIIEDPSAVADALRAAGRRVVAPAIRSGVMVLAPMAEGERPPRGVADEQAPGAYRLTAGDPGRWFDYVVGPQSWKAWLHPPREPLWRATRDEMRFEPVPDDWPPTAFFGVRACEIAAMRVLDRALAGTRGADPRYMRRRQDVFVVAVNCARSADTCFCVSAGTGPRAEDGFDLALTELDGRLLLEAGSARGREIADALDPAPATAADRAEARAAAAAAARMQSRRLPGDVAEALRESAESPLWDEIGERCLGCGACALSCPTCFCSDIEDATGLDGETVERRRVWDSCFSLDFSRIGGGPVRRGRGARYRQWMTHKLAWWIDQFGCSGCVGCGRCLTWCPVGIDLTAEAARFSAARRDA